MSAPVATFFYLVWPPARLPALLRSCCSFGTLACCRRSCTPVCLRKRDLVLVLFRVVAFGVGLIFDPAAVVCAALCCYLTGVEPGRWLPLHLFLLLVLCLFLCWGVFFLVAAVGLFLSACCHSCGKCSFGGYPGALVIGGCHQHQLPLATPSLGRACFCYWFGVCFCVGACFPGGCCEFGPVCLLPQLRQLLFRWVPRCSCLWGLSLTPTASSNTAFC